MSELTQCNFCNLDAIKRQAAKEKDMKVVTIPSMFKGGTVVFIVPKETTRKEILAWRDCDKCPPNGDASYEKYWTAWLMKVSDSCQC